MRFIILSRAKSAATNALSHRLAPFGDVTVIEDIGPHPEGYEMLTTLKRVTAWDRAFVNLNADSAVWFIEDDVHLGSDANIADLFSKAAKCGADLCATYIASKAEEPDWSQWESDFYFKHQRKSFNPICRLSAELIGRVLAFRELHNKFIFHEILFASLAKSYWNMQHACPELFGCFHWRPLVLQPKDDRIEHPVKIQCHS
jgi:hypothetical protein